MLSQVVTMVVCPATSGWAISLRSILTGLGVFLLGSFSDVWLQHHGGTLLLAVVDDALVGVATGLLVFLYERRQNKVLIRKLEVIRLVNHHVRNSLQVIAAANSCPKQEELAKQVEIAVERIEWALREVLPGQQEDINDLVFDTRSMTPSQSPKIVA